VSGPSVGLPSISVIVPVHDDPEGVRRCLAGLRDQDYPLARVQVLVCDNASTRTVGDVSGATGGELSVSVLTEPVPGSYRARNTCLSRATGEVLAFTDADCTPDREWLSRGVSALQAGSDLAAGRVQVYAERGRANPMEVHEMVAAFPQQKYVERMNFGVTANLFVRRAVVDAIGPFAEDLTSGGDREFCQRAVSAGHRLVYVPDAVVRHPARATVAEVWKKVRRVRRGAFEERQLPVSVVTWLRRLVPPLGAVARSRDPRVPAGARWKYVVGETAAHYLAVAAEFPYVARSARSSLSRSGS
jgi:cellulose synthase/poly-beta-1,6-N-acetylglucosamine synthase-like glycosyltransferase